MQAPGNPLAEPQVRFLFEKKGGSYFGILLSQAYVYPPSFFETFYSLVSHKTVSLYSK